MNLSTQAPALRDAGIQPLAVGQQAWQEMGIFNNLIVAVGGAEIWQKVYGDKDPAAIDSPEMAAVFDAIGDARELGKGSSIQDWNQATAMVIAGTAGGQIMGDWAQGEFALAGQVAGTDYTCLPGLGLSDVISTDGDAFYFPVNRDPDIIAAQDALATTILSADAQIAFNSKKGSLPIRGDIDLAATNDCTKKGLEILATGTIVQNADSYLTPDTTGQLSDLMVQFFSEDSISTDDLKSRFAAIMADAS